MNIHVIYHHPCNDGITCAVILRENLYDVYDDFDEVVFHPWNVKDKDGFSEEFLSQLCETDLVYVVDFSFPGEMLLQLSHKVEQVYVLDHHKTFKEEMETWLGVELGDKFYEVFENICVTYDVDRCGSCLVLEHLLQLGLGYYPPENQFVDYVQDRDLWNWELPQSKEVNAFFDVYDNTLEDWTELMAEWCDKGLEFAVSVGTAILSAQDNRVRNACNNFRFVEFHEYPGVKIPCVNSMNDMSEIGAQLLEDHPEAPFSAIYFDTDRGQKWSLRSRKGSDVDVSAIAKARGGGGHASAAGFDITIGRLNVL